MSKRSEGRDEPVLDPEIPIIDTHHHLFGRPALAAARRGGFRERCGCDERGRALW
jgi:hypothetical protein